MAEVIHIQSLENPLVKHLTKLRTDARYRKEQNKVLLVGKTLLREYTAQNQLSTLIIAEESNKIDMPAARTVLVKMNILKKITGLENPEGYAAEVELPKASSLKECRSILAMDAVSDPGNMGTLFRSAMAFGWEGVFLLPGCCDPVLIYVMAGSWLMASVWTDLIMAMSSTI